MRQAGIIAAAGLYALEHNTARLAEDHANAKRLAAALAEMKRIAIQPDQVETNIVIFDIAKSRYTPLQAVEALKQHGLLVVSFGKNLLRAVTHLDVNRAQIDQAIRIFNKVLG